MYDRIIDANINRISEGLRVIEEFTRFELSDEALSVALATLRYQVNQSEQDKVANLMGRDTSADARAGHAPAKRKEISDVLIANFKRAQEGLRVLEEYTGLTLYNQIRYTLYELEKEIVLKSKKPRILPGLYLISDQVEILKKGLASGVSLIQLRGKSDSKETLYNKAKEIVPLAKKAGIPCLINDYLDIVLGVEADGLHTGQDDISVKDQRKLLGHHKLIGRTTHDLSQGLLAEAEGADYVSVGPIWETPSKPGRLGIGFEYLESASKQLKIPYVAIGGINRETLVEILPYKPPIVGLIRDYEHISEIQDRLKNNHLMG